MAAIRRFASEVARLGGFEVLQMCAPLVSGVLEDWGLNVRLRLLYFQAKACSERILFVGHGYARPSCVAESYRSWSPGLRHRYIVHSYRHHVVYLREKRFCRDRYSDQQNLLGNEGRLGSTRC